ncbi:MAG: hypothetical protein NT150_01175 [Bacteroidetes bacterium]|nr:hypothetical protein [Bacteroidota bacterium]
MTDFKITIPKPCHENWDQMTPNEQGKHCCACEKTVVDFTKMEAQEIKSFFESRKTEKVCGHFYASQVHKEIPKLHQSLLKLQSFIEKKLTLPPVKRLALSGLGVVMLIAGCSENKKEKPTTGLPIPSTPPVHEKTDSLKSDNTRLRVKPITTSIIYDTETVISGNVAFYEPKTLTGITFTPDTKSDFWQHGMPKAPLNNIKQSPFLNEGFQNEVIKEK